MWSVKSLSSLLCVLIAMKHFDPQPHEDEERSFMHIVENAYCRDVVSLCPNIHPAMRDVPEIVYIIHIYIIIYIYLGSTQREITEPMCQRQPKRGPWNGTKCGARWVWVQGPQERAALQGADVSVVCLSNQIGFYRMVQLDSPKILDVLERAVK